LYCLPTKANPAPSSSKNWLIFSVKAASTPQSDLAKQTLKDPYCFDFLNLTEKHNEKELEAALTENISQFLLELGAGFAFVGKQYKLTVSDKDFYIDLLFYHIKLRCYVVIELKTTEFKPEFVGKLNFYISAVDDRLANDKDNATIGLGVFQGLFDKVRLWGWQVIFKIALCLALALK
jgi:predicted nuclease of restriction endonuclease-like (RecB) superfamily